jgi:hypothetical protein
MQPFWLPIGGYEDKYRVSRDGSIWSVKNNRLLKPYGDTSGYRVVQLCRDGKRIQLRLHRLVASVFIPNPLNLPEVNHLDGDRANNVVSNLEWSTKSDNGKHAYDVLKRTRTVRRLTPEQVEEIKNASGSSREIARRLNVSRSSVLRIRP